MKILFDHQIFSAQAYGGISRYHVALMRHLNNLEGVSCDLSCRFSNNEYLLHSGLFPVKSFFRKNIFKSKTTLLAAINTAYSKKKLRQKAFDVFHPTYYHDYFLPDLGKKPFVITCHDLTMEKFGTGQLEKGKVNTLRNASKIIAVSQNTKNDIISYYGIDPDRIEVIYLAHEQEEISEYAPINVPGQYILYVGLRQGYKNFANFVRAVSSLLKKYPDIHIVCAGGNPFTRDELILFDELKVRDKVVFQRIEENNLPAIYKNAIAFCFPSLYEGFGIPVLETFSNHCPAVLSDTGSLPEIAGEAALYFNPHDTDSILVAVTRIVEDAALRAILIQRGESRLQHFSWQQTARQTLKLYQEVTC